MWVPPGDHWGALELPSLLVSCLGLVPSALTQMSLLQLSGSASGRDSRRETNTIFVPSGDQEG